MSDYWQELLKYVSSFAVAAGAITWLIKSVITHVLSKDIESYKTRLKAETDKELEMFKSQLQIAAKEHDVSYTKLHEKRFEIIAKLYSLLEQARTSTEFLSITSRSREVHELEKRATDTLAKWTEASKFYKENKLYLSKEVCNQLDRIITDMGMPSITYHIYSKNPEQFADDVKDAIEDWNKVSSNVKATLVSIEDEFRAMISSDNNPASNNGMHPTADTRAVKSLSQNY